MKQSVSSILISTDGEFILQQRENKPGIARPGMITNFGGGMEEGEKPLDAIIREIREELNIQLNETDFTYLGSSVRKNPLSNNKYLAHLFVARDIEKDSLSLEEGEAIVYLKPGEPLDSLNLSPGTKEILSKFKKGIK